MKSRLENIHWFAKLINYKKRRKTSENEKFRLRSSRHEKCKSMDLGKKLQKKNNYFLRFGEVIILSLKWLNVIFFVQSV